MVYSLQRDVANMLNTIQTTIATKKCEAVNFPFDLPAETMMDFEVVVDWCQLNHGKMVRYCFISNC